MPEALVVADRITRTYMVDGSSTQALAEASFSIAPGDLIALMGQSGSGKTTLLHLISGLDAPTTGVIAWPALGVRSTLRPDHIAIAFQGASLIPALSVAENVALPLLLGGAAPDAADADAAAMIERLGLADLSAKLPDELSGGQSQRVALARALVMRPELLLADEPTGQQDRIHADRLLDHLFELAAEQGIAVLAATHDPLVAARLARPARRQALQQIGRQLGEFGALALR